MDQFFGMFSQADSATIHVYQQTMRYLIPVLVTLLLIRCIRPLLTFRREPEIWAWLKLEDDRLLPITHWESIIGSSKRSDVVISLPGVSKTHAVLTRYDDGSWTISDRGTKSGIRVNGERIDICALEPEDEINIGGVNMHLVPISRRQELKLAELRTKATHPIHSIANVLLLTVIQCLIGISYLFALDIQYAQPVFTGFLGMMICQWALLIFYICIKKPSFEIEAIAFFLCTMGMAAIAAVKPGESVKQLLALVMGLSLFLFLGWAMRDLERAKKLRYYAAVAGVGFLLITMLFGQEYHGAKNWIVIGGMSFQLSELSKVCFVFVGASTMDRIVNKRNLILFIGYTLAVCGCLAVMNDFGTALIFFTAFLLIAYIRSGSVGTVALACTSLGFAGVIALKIAPHALRRFSSWRHIWEDPLNKGYQQTRAIMCLASGGLFGLGAGKGWMENVFAADSDVVIATVAEEWGLLIVLMMICCVLAFGMFAIRSAAVERSTFFTIGSCAAAGILLVQAILNALGTVDILPLTGVTFPFVSNGGSSMIGTWGLLAFVKAADTRQNASFAVRQSKEGRPDDE
ncbi:MAG: FtsW/RodA/SpoVE family cell cycle protein [Oscillospiraceae bacterium]|nr:FtsW/RodA/SpoVE family cell cycle protein [Oscillospiraceae bacterium]